MPSAPPTLRSAERVSCGEITCTTSRWPPSSALAHPANRQRASLMPSPRLRARFSAERSADEPGVGRLKSGGASRREFVASRSPQVRTLCGPASGDGSLSGGACGTLPGASACVSWGNSSDHGAESASWKQLSRPRGAAHFGAGEDGARRRLRRRVSEPRRQPARARRHSKVMRPTHVLLPGRAGVNRTRITIAEADPHSTPLPFLALFPGTGASQSATPSDFIQPQSPVFEKRGTGGQKAPRSAFALALMNRHI